jgi:hypothetical protein
LPGIDDDQLGELVRAGTGGFDDPLRPFGRSSVSIEGERVLPTAYHSACPTRRGTRRSAYLTVPSREALGSYCPAWFDGW